MSIRNGKLRDDKFISETCVNSEYVNNKTLQTRENKQTRKNLSVFLPFSSHQRIYIFF
jgi:hypothetical protein